jgi:hypothetical protein
LQQCVLQLTVPYWVLVQPWPFQQDGLLHERDLLCVPLPQFLLQLP